MLSPLHHPHLVNLVRYCADGEHRVVYEDMSNGSLEDRLLALRFSDIAPNKKPLDLNMRMKLLKVQQKVSHTCTKQLTLQ